MNDTPAERDQCHDNHTKPRAAWLCVSTRDRQFHVHVCGNHARRYRSEPDKWELRALLARDGRFRVEWLSAEIGCWEPITLADSRFLPHELRCAEQTAAHSTLSWQGEWCKRCDRRNVAAWHVPDTTWSAVVMDRWNILCPACFDEEAQASSIAYQFNDHPALLSWSDWTAALSGDGKEGV